jgi:hypothetical protein
MGSWSRVVGSVVFLAALAAMAGGCGGGAADPTDDPDNPVPECSTPSDTKAAMAECTRVSAQCGDVVVDKCFYSCGRCPQGSTCVPDQPGNDPQETWGRCVADDDPDGGEPDDDASVTDGPEDTPQISEDATASSDAKEAGGGTPGLCAAAPAGDLPIPASIDGTLTGPGNIGTSRCFGLTVGPDTFYKLTITDKATGVDIKAQLTPADTVPDQTLVVSSRQPCDGPDPGAEIQCDVHRNKGTGPDLHQIFQPGTYLIAVDSFQVSQDAGVSSSWTLPFHLTTETFTFPPNVFCASAVEVMDGTMLKMQDASAGVDSLTAKCERLAVGKVVYFKATVPAGQTLTAKSSGRSGLRLLSSCDATTCLASAKDIGTGDGATAMWMNGGAAATTVYLALGSNDASTSASYDLSVSIK